MSVKTTRILKDFLEEEKESSDVELCARFEAWKKSSDEYSSYFFGKDGKYIAPTVAGNKYILCHVHIVPILDEKQLSLWNRAWKHGKRKTSDRALVYVSDNRGNFLLIAILEEPNAHKVADMKTQQDKELMVFFATVAEEFIFDGSIKV
jgi:mRNA interferase YafO